MDGSPGAGEPRQRCVWTAVGLANGDAGRLRIRYAPNVTRDTLTIIISVLCCKYHMRYTYNYQHECDPRITQAILIL